MQTPAAANINSANADLPPSFGSLSSSNSSFSGSKTNFDTVPSIIPPPPPPIQASNASQFTVLPSINGGGPQGGNSFDLFSAPPPVTSSQSRAIPSIGEDIFGIPFNANGAAPSVAPLAASSVNMLAPQQDTFSSIFESPPAQISSQPLFPQNTGIHVGARSQQETKFETKSTVWSDSINKGLIDLNISGRKDFLNLLFHDFTFENALLSQFHI